MKTLTITLFAVLAFGCAKHEHAGTAAAASGATASGTKEHGGHEQEHGGKEHAGAPAKKEVTAADIKTAMNAHITAETGKGGGVFKINDAKTGENLELVFVKIHDPVRKIEKSVSLPAGYFACTDFSVKGAPEKLYDLDFWLNEELKITETRIHKHPEKVGDKWEKKARYTFVDDKPVEIK